jgi:hypothetical protein
MQDIRCPLQLIQKAWPTTGWQGTVLTRFTNLVVKVRGPIWRFHLDPVACVHHLGHKHSSLSCCALKRAFRDKRRSRMRQAGSSTSHQTRPNLCALGAASAAHKSHAADSTAATQVHTSITSAQPHTHSHTPVSGCGNLATTALCCRQGGNWMCLRRQMRGIHGSRLGLVTPNRRACNTCAACGACLAPQAVQATP